jgi:hypothetical protein
MIKKSNFKSYLGIGVFGLMAFCGSVQNVSAQGTGDDPFRKPVVKTVKPATPKVPTTTTVVAPAPSMKPVQQKPVKVIPPPPMTEKAPTIEERLAYYYKMREIAAMNGQPLPKPTTVMTIDELAVNGVFRNSKGLSAIVEATPIKLSYTVYPGEKFFDGQLVAIEENRLVFRRITRWSNGKTVASEEGKPLRTYSVKETLQGTAPVEQSAQSAQAGQTPKAESQQQSAPQTSQNGASQTDKNGAMVSPLEQWEKDNKAPKSEPVKDAKNKNSKETKTVTDKKSTKVSDLTKSSKKTAVRIAQSNK